MNTFVEIDYEIEAACDEYGDFPLYCAILLFDLLNLNENIIIKNQYSIKAEKTNVIQQYNIGQNCYYEWPKSPEGNYCIWIKESYTSNQTLIDILKLQGTYLSYIVPTDSFDWEYFVEKWEEDDGYLLSTGQATFICNVIDMDRTLNLNFNSAVFSKEMILDLITKWEKEIGHIAQFTQIRRMATTMRSKRGNKHLVRLCLI